MKKFQVDTESRDGWTVIQPQGDIDVYNAPQLRDTIAEKMGLGPPNIILNLELVDFIDSTGLAIMIGALKRAKEINGAFVLVKPNDQVSRVLRITDLTKVLPVFDSIDNALADSAHAVHRSDR
jgi:anti-sigma B factor antagonist